MHLKILGLLCSFCPIIPFSPSPSRKGLYTCVPHAFQEVSNLALLNSLHLSFTNIRSQQSNSQNSFHQIDRTEIREKGHTTALLLADWAGVPGTSLSSNGTWWDHYLSDCSQKPDQPYSCLLSLSWKLLTLLMKGYKRMWQHGDFTILTGSADIICSRLKSPKINQM